MSHLFMSMLLNDYLTIAKLCLIIVTFSLRLS